MADSLARDDGFVRLGREEPDRDAPRAERAPPLPGPALFGQLLDEGVELLRANFLALTVIAAALAWGVGLAVDAVRGPDPDAVDTQLLQLFVRTVGVTVALGMLLGLAGRLALARHEPDPAERSGGPALRRARWGAGIGAVVVSSLIVVVGLVPLLLPGVWLAFRLTYAPIAGFHEGLGPFAALRRSWRLTAGRDLFSRWIGVVFVAWLLAVIPSGMAAGIETAELQAWVADRLGVDLGTASLALEPLRLYLGGLGAALGAAVLGRFQLDLLARRDGTDLRRRLALCFPGRGAR